MNRTSLVIVNKNERLLNDTLAALKPFVGHILHEVLVVDASDGALEDIRLIHDWARWIDYTQPPNVRITIAHQRNLGVRCAEGDVIVFTDSGCLPEDGWLERLLTPILEEGEFVSCGPARAIGKSVYSRVGWTDSSEFEYVSISPFVAKLSTRWGDSTSRLVRRRTSISPGA